jgi:uncharacterized membrane protein
MQVLPEGFTLPPLPYLLVLLAAVGLVAVGLYRRDPHVTERHVLALAPWMAAGSALHVLYVVEALPEPIRPLGGTAAVYLTVAALAGATWLAAGAAVGRRPGDGAGGGRGVGSEAGDGGENGDGSGVAVPGVLAATGTVAAAIPVAAAVAWGLDRGSFRPVWTVVILAGGGVVAAATWTLLARLRPTATSATGWVGALAVFGHSLDAVSTAVGVGVLGFGERTPASRLIIELGRSLPTAELIGGAWLFVLVKLLVAGAVVALFGNYVREEPTEGYLLLGLVAAVGLGPGVHNVVLFAVA